MKKSTWVLVLILNYINLSAQSSKDWLDRADGLFELRFMSDRMPGSDTIKVSALYSNTRDELRFVIDTTNKYRRPFYIDPDSTWLNHPAATLLDTTLVVYYFLAKNLFNKDRVIASAPYSYSCLTRKSRCWAYHCRFFFLGKEWSARIKTYKNAIIEMSLGNYATPVSLSNAGALIYYRHFLYK